MLLAFNRRCEIKFARACLARGTHPLSVGASFDIVALAEDHFGVDEDSSLAQRDVNTREQRPLLLVFEMMNREAGYDRIEGTRNGILAVIEQEVTQL